MDIEMNELIGALQDNIKDDLKDFEDLINLDGALRREIFIGDITDGVGSSVDGYIRFWNDYDNDHNIPAEEREPIKIYIDSCGGNLVDTLTVIDSIKMSKTPVWTIAIGCAYSGGFFITVSGHKRFAYPHASFLFHEGSTQMGGSSGQFENQAGFYKKQLAQLKDIVMNGTTLSEDWYKEHCREDIWWTADEALENGIIDKVSEELI